MKPYDSEILVIHFKVVALANGTFQTLARDGHLT
jgi:hypothetical protein